MTKVDPHALGQYRLTPRERVLRSTYGAAVRDGAHDRAEQARAELAQLKVERRVREAVAGAPPLSADVRARLAALLRPLLAPPARRARP